jgi:hypothetical protein
MSPLMITFLNTILLLSISDCISQYRLFMKQGGVDRLNGFLSENSPQRHHDLASLVMKNVLLGINSIDPDGMYLYILP